MFIREQLKRCSRVWLEFTIGAMHAAKDITRLVTIPIFPFFLRGGGMNRDRNNMRDVLFTRL